MALTFSTGLANALAGKTIAQAYTPTKAADITDGASFKTCMEHGFLDIFGGTRPANPDTTEGSTKLVRIAHNGSTGLHFEATGEIASGKVQKVAADVWSGVVTLAGTATWFRFYSANTDDTGGASTYYLRFDGSVGTTSASDLQLASTSLALAAPLIITTFDVQMPTS